MDSLALNQGQQFGEAVSIKQEPKVILYGLLAFSEL